MHEEVTSGSLAALRRYEGFLMWEVGDNMIICATACVDHKSLVGAAVVSQRGQQVPQVQH
jgi:hypothetical protein